MNNKSLLLTAIWAMIALTAFAASGRRLQYRPEGREIVSVNGNNRYTRALYGGYTDFRIETSDRPIFATFRNKSHRNIRFRLHLNGKSQQLDNVAHCESRYYSGMRTYKLTDSSWGKASLTLTVLALPDSESGIWKFEANGFTKGTKLECIVCDILRPNFYRWGDMNADPADSFEPAKDESNRITAQCDLDKKISYISVECNDKGVYTVKELSSKEGGITYKKAYRYHQWLANQIVFDTPDPYINTMGGNLVAAADGAWDGEVWLHGAVVWRTKLNGWRAGYLGDVLGMPERSRSHFSAYAASQITDVEPVIPHPTMDPEMGLARAAKTWGTEMYSNGYICREPNRKDLMHHYDMNLNYIDELLWHFQYDADTVYMRKMWPVLTSHLAWEKRNYDPDNDGLYDAYCCIWASDALYYNSGAVTHSSAYNYRAFSIAARIAELLGEDAAYYRQEAEKTLQAMNERLWMKDRGHWAEYQDLMGLKRLHKHAALWSIYTPIDCGAATEEQAFQATQYVDHCIPHIPVKVQDADSDLLSLQTISTTDWQPYAWSINNVASNEVMHMALAYFQAGRNEEGFQLIKANTIDQAYLGDSPGNVGQISYYDKVRGEIYRDFSDNAGISARTFIQGLYGIVPDALNGRCIIRPGFPAHWEKASIKTPYMKYSFRREGNKEIYVVEQNFSQPLQIILRQNTGMGYVETIGSDKRKQTFVVTRPQSQKAPEALAKGWYTEGKNWGNNFDDVQTGKLEMVKISGQFNSNVSDIFKNFYLSPRSPYTTLQIPVHGIGEWCHPEIMADIDDSAIRKQTVNGTLKVDIENGLVFQTPAKGKNIVYTSLWDNYPNEVSFPLTGKATHAYLLMAGSTNHMQSHIDNGEIIVEYTDSTTDKLPLHNPHNWCPIEQDYYEDGLAFHTALPRPYRIDFASGRVSRNLLPMNERFGDRNYAKGAGVILDMPLNGDKQLCKLTVRTLSNDVVIGLMAITLQR